MPSPEMLRCRVPDSVTFVFGTGAGVGGSGFLLGPGNATVIPDGGYVVLADGSVTGFAVWVDTALPRDWKLYVDGVEMSGGPILDTTSDPAPWDTYRIGEYPVEAGSRVSVAYVGAGGGPATSAIATVQVTFD